MKYINLFTLLIIGLQSTIQTAQESSDFAKATMDKKVDTEETRQQIIKQATLDFPHLVEGLDIIRKIFYSEVPSFQDYLQEKLAKDDEDPNFGELHCEIQDCIIAEMNNSIICIRLYLTANKNGVQSHIAAR